jgi:hypothetical protein
VFATEAAFAIVAIFDVIR